MHNLAANPALGDPLDARCLSLLWTDENDSVENGGSLHLECASKDSCDALVDELRHLQNKEKNVVKLKGLDPATCDVEAVKRIFHDQHPCKFVTFDRDGTARIVFKDRATAKKAMNEMHALVGALHSGEQWTYAPATPAMAAQSSSSANGAGLGAGGGQRGNFGGLVIEDPDHDWDDEDGLHIEV